MSLVSPITLFEHETIAFDWADGDLATLERMRRSQGMATLVATAKSGRRALQATQYVGVTRLGQRTVQVLPKIYRSEIGGDERERVQSATRNLMYMLTYTAKVAIREHSVASLAAQKLDWFDILTRIFAHRLQEEWERGANRAYQPVEDELPYLKGKWHIEAHLRRPERKHRFEVTHDEFSPDNEMNRILRYVVERLWHTSKDATNRRLLGEQRQWMENVQLVPHMDATETTSIQMTRLNKRYLPLLNLARIFLSGQSLSVQAGDVPTFAFFFDMNRLFESFVTQFVMRHRTEILAPTLANCDLLPQSRGATLYLAQSGTAPVALLKPDLVLRAPNENRFPLIVDMKYKRLTATDMSLGIAHEDLLQMHAYLHRYGCRRSVVLYPQTADMTESLLRRISLLGGDKVITIATIDLQSDLWKTESQQRLIGELKAAFAMEEDDD